MIREAASKGLTVNKCSHVSSFALGQKLTSEADADTEASVRQDKRAGTSAGKQLMKLLRSARNPVTQHSALLPSCVYSLSFVRVPSGII